MPLFPQSSRIFSGCGFGFVALLITSLFVSNSAFAGEQVDKVDNPTVELFFLDVGQGDAILVHTKDEKNLLVDTGPPSAKALLLSRLNSLGVNHLDGLLVTHPHADHMGNAVAIIKTVPTRAIFDPGYQHTTQTYDNFLREIETRSIRYVQPREGMNISLGKHVVMEVLGPQTPLLAGTRSDANSNSVIVRLVAGKTRILLTGDAEEETESQLLGLDPSRLQSDVLKVAHHGSKYATSSHFLSVVSPKAAVISCGKNNKYGHPASETLDRLKQGAIEVLLTNKHGEITLTTDGKNYAIFPSPTPSVQTPASKTPLQVAQDSRINLNSAGEGELVSLRGIGPAKAKAIIAHRNKIGAFTSVDQLVQVKGIGVKTLEKLRPLITVGEVGSAPPSQPVAAPQADGSSVSSGSNPQPAGNAIHLNTATASELTTLPGIGPSKAKAIIEYRKTLPNGFATVEQLTSVRGIGQKTLEKLRHLVTVH